MAASLTAQLLVLVDRDRRPPWLLAPTAEAELARAMADARAAAAIEFTDAQALAALARVVDADAPAPAALRLADLVLVERAVAGDPAAEGHLGGPLRDALRPALRHLGLDDAAIDEVLGDLLPYLLVAEAGAPPRLLGYRGHGPLRRWLRTIAVRRAYRAGAAPRVAGDDAPLATLAADDDPELVTLQRRYAAAFRGAFTAALADLSPRQRSLLRLHHFERLTVDDLGALHKVHRSTVARWLTRAREALHAGTLARLQAAVGGAAPAEAASLIRLVRSQLDLSLDRLLGDEPGAGEDDPAR